MILQALILIPLISVFFISGLSSFDLVNKDNILKKITLIISIINLILSLVMFILYDNSSKNFQFLQEHLEISYYEFFLGVDGLSIYFILLTTLIIPISILSN
jgi:NADH-ubiquinone oxidoreductase chain 4